MARSALSSPSAEVSYGESKLAGHFLVELRRMSGVVTEGPIKYVVIRERIELGPRCKVAARHRRLPTPGKSSNVDFVLQGGQDSRSYTLRPKQSGRNRLDDWTANRRVDHRVNL